MSLLWVTIPQALFCGGVRLKFKTLKTSLFWIFLSFIFCTRICKKKNWAATTQPVFVWKHFISISILAVICKFGSQNSACGIVTHRGDITLICFFLREVWGECGEVVKGKVTYRRYAPVLNLIRLSVQYDFVLCTLRFSPDIKSRFCPFYILV